MTALPAWLVFLISAAAVAVAGVRLAKDGDRIADLTGLGGLWVGAILVAAATSLPELLTDAHAVLQGNPSLAVGDLFGSSMANMMILAVADLLTRGGRILTRVAINQALVGTLAICLTILAAAGVLTGSGFAVIGLGWPSVAIAFGYAAGMRLMHRNRPEPPFDTTAPRPQHGQASSRLRSAMIGFAVATLVIVIAAPYVASSAAEIAVQLGISQGFVGMVLLAFTTSLPELVVSVTCVRQRSYDLAVGNLLGSNCFNMAVVIPLDLIDGHGSLLAGVEPALVVGALFAVLMMGLALLDVLNKSERRIWVLEPGPTFMILAYFAGLYLTYRLGQ